MSLLTELLKEVPLSAALQEKVKSLEVQKAELKQQLNDCRRTHQICQNENAELVARLEGIGRFHRGIKFRKNVATAQKWMPFCPICDSILQVVEPSYAHLGLRCPKPGCAFRSSFPSSEVEMVIAELRD
jgi:hypothetical protein